MATGANALNGVPWLPSWQQRAGDITPPNAWEQYAAYYNTATTVTVSYQYNTLYQQAGTGFQTQTYRCTPGGMIETAGNPMAYTPTETPPTRQLTPEEIRALELAVETKARLAEEAKTKARALLLSVLNEEQRATFEATGHFFVVAPSGRRYELLIGHQPRRVDATGRALAHYCIHTGHHEGVPREDELCSWAVMLNCAESLWLDIANETLTGFGAAEAAERAAATPPLIQRARQRAGIALQGALNAVGAL